METFPQKRQIEILSNGFNDGIDRAIHWLEAQQQPDGFWVGMLKSNSCMEAQWILAMHFLGIDDDPKYHRVVRSVLNEQRTDGSWEIYYEAPQGDINATVECYAALRSAGLDPKDGPLQKARGWIFDRGGLSGIRVFTKFWLALIGEWPWRDTPSIPPELIFLPAWFPVNIYEFASWARATIIPLSILSSLRPVRPLPPDRRLDELFPDGRQKTEAFGKRPGRRLSKGGFFYRVDRLLSLYVSSPWQPGRNLARTLCTEWIIKHQDADGAWGGIQPPWIYSLMALKAQGYPCMHPVISGGLEAFDAHWSYEKNGAVYLQASESPIWDTLLSVTAMLDCGKTPQTSPGIGLAIEWILKKQITTSPGDWQVKVRGVPCGGWAFERANTQYPDIDDTALAMIVLARVRRFFTDTSMIDRALALAVEWILAMQCSNGGWAAFDRNNTNRFLTRLPFFDFGEALDPPSVDVTAHVVEALGLLGRRLNDPTISRAVKYIRDEQESEGSWFGRWGVNHIYGTAAVLPAMAAVGEDMSAPYIRKAADWLSEHQNADGGWGETCGSYMDDALRGVGKSTASQTGWAIIALLSLNTHAYDFQIKRGIENLLANQKNGTWDEPNYTGTGFPGYGQGGRANLKGKGTTLAQGTELSRGFMINYNLYRHYFPLMALGRAREHFKCAKSCDYDFT
jgi:squalene-hopene/tetraprenyl-beta-curcumene cyclase